MARLSHAQLFLDSGQEAHGLPALVAAMALGREHGSVSSHVWISPVLALLKALIAFGGRVGREVQLCPPRDDEGDGIASGPKKRVTAPRAPSRSP
jgi:hypothetical protein